MKKSVLLLLVLFGISGAAWSQVQVGISAGSGGDNFYLAIGNYYHAPPAQVTVLQQRHIPDEEMPVVFFVSQRAHVGSDVIVNLRAGGTSWVEIFRRYRVDPRALYVPMRGNLAGSPYSGYYAYYHGGKRARLADSDIVNMVNLRFASEYYHHTPEEVFKLRAAGKNYRYIHEQYGPHRKAPPARVKDRRDDRRNDRRDDRHDDRRNDR